VVSAGQLEAARLYFSGRRGAIAGTGPSMCSARSTLLEYLMLCINALNGAWQRAEETSWAPGVLGPEMAQKAQATPPFAAYDIGEQMVAHGLKESLAGLPTGYLPEQMLN